MNKKNATFEKRQVIEASIYPKLNLHAHDNSAINNLVLVQTTFNSPELITAKSKKISNLTSNKTNLILPAITFIVCSTSKELSQSLLSAAALYSSIQSNLSYSFSTNEAIILFALGHNLQYKSSKNLDLLVLNIHDYLSNYSPSRTFDLATIKNILIGLHSSKCVSIKNNNLTLTEKIVYTHK